MNESYEVVTAALTSHARTLDELTAQLRQTQETARVNLTGDTYGQIGQSFVAAAEALARAGRDALQSEVDALESATTAMRATITEYEQQESDSRARLAAAADGLGQEIPAPGGTTDPASTSDIPTASAASVRSPEPVRLASIDPATTAAASLAPGTPVPPPAPETPSLRDTPPGSGPPSTSSFHSTNSTKQNRVLPGVQSAPGTARAIPTSNPARPIPDVGSVNGRYGDDRTGRDGAIKDAVDLTMAPSPAVRAVKLALVEAGVITPDPESRLGAFAATRGYPRGTVGHAVHLGIAAIYMSLDDAAQEKIGRVFNSPEARALYSQPIDSDANLEMARTEFEYWSNVRREDPWSLGANIATQISPEQRAEAHRAFSILPTIPPIAAPPIHPPPPPVLSPPNLAPPVRPTPPPGQN